MSPDPGPDRTLTKQLVAQLVGHQFPELRQLAIEFVAEGWDNEVFLVGDEWIFRFPKRASVVPWMEREIKLMPKVEAVIGVPVPRFEKVGHADLGFPYPFVGYRRLPGIQVDQATAFDRASLAKSLGAALTRLHLMDPSLVPSAPQQPGGDPEMPSGVPSWDEVLSFVPNGLRAEARSCANKEVPEPYFTGPPRVHHSDICPDHILVDESTGQLSGILDFADMVVGDPVGDFVGLVPIDGYGFVSEVLANYDVPLDKTFLERLHWRSRTMTLHWLRDALAEGSDVAMHQLWLQRAFATSPTS
jgi:aminoglycoside phosphotransferase (APT) family kinase protein